MQASHGLIGWHRFASNRSAAVPPVFGAAVARPSIREVGASLRTPITIHVYYRTTVCSLRRTTGTTVIHRTLEYQAFQIAAVVKHASRLLDSRVARRPALNPAHGCAAPRNEV